jgi:hypothetical protein
MVTETGVEVKSADVHHKHAVAATPNHIKSIDP